MRIVLASALALCIATPALASEQAEIYAIFHSDAAARAESAPKATPVSTDATAPAVPEVSATGSVARIVTERAVAHGIDPALAHAVVKIESRYRCSAVGRAGELGAMQVKPATARSVGVTGNLKDCATGIEAGMRYLREALNRHGEGCAGISSYNMGIHRASSRCTAYGRKVMAAMANVQTASLR